METSDFGKQKLGNIYEEGASNRFLRDQHAHIKKLYECGNSNQR
jgi:hypothetical protein